MIRSNNKNKKSSQASITNFFQTRKPAKKSLLFDNELIGLDASDLNTSNLGEDVTYKNGLPTFKPRRDSPISKGKSPEKLIDLSQTSQKNGKLNLLDKINNDAEEDEIQNSSSMNEKPALKRAMSRETILLSDDFDEINKKSSKFSQSSNSNSDIEFYKQLKQKKQKLASSQSTLLARSTHSPVAPISPLGKTSAGSSLSDLMKLGRSSSNLKSVSSQASSQSSSFSSSSKLISSFSRGARLTTKPSLFLNSSSFSSKVSDTQASSDGIQLTDEQEKVVNFVLKDNFNVFYTGSAGTGKSVVLKTLIRSLKAKYGKDAVAICASTGLASCNIGGTTVHKFSGFGIGNRAIEQLYMMVSKNPTALKRWRATKIIIIDEVSMIEGEYLDKLEAIARRVRNNNNPFGGIQVVFTGDFFQLPPVTKNGMAKRFCFESSAWRRAIQKTILLNKVFRQKDNSLITMLNEIRYGNRVSFESRNLIASLERTIDYPDGIQATELYPTRAEVSHANRKRMELLPGEVISFSAVDIVPSFVKDKEAEIKKLDSSFLAEKTLQLKENCQVMMIKNHSDQIVNGSVGSVLFFLPMDLYVYLMGFYKNIPEKQRIHEFKLVSHCVGIKDSASLPSEVSEYIAKSLDLELKGRMENGIARAMKYIKAAALPVVRFQIPDGTYSEEIVERNVFSTDASNSSKTASTREQLPLILCYALSIHKSQGQTIQRLRVDLRNVFEAGHVYVALSRAVSLDSLEVRNFDVSKISCDEKVKEFYRSMTKL